MWVCFLLTVVFRVLSGLWETSTSKMASFDSDSFSIVNCLFYGIDVMVELIYILSFEGTKGIIYITLPELRWTGVSGKSSITSSATTTDTGDPIAVGSVGRMFHGKQI